MSVLDDLMDNKLEQELKEPSKKAPPKGQARATLVEYGASRDVTAKGQLFAIKPAYFLVEGQPYNDEIGRPSLKVRYDLWVAVTESGGIDYGKVEEGQFAGQDKNARLARFFKSFGRDTTGTSFNDLIGTDCVVGLDAEIDNRSGEPTGYAKVTWTGKAA